MKFFFCIILIISAIAKNTSGLIEDPSNFCNKNDLDSCEGDSDERRGPYGGQYVSPSSPFEIVYEWKIFDYEYPSLEERQAAIDSEEFIPEYIVPMAIHAYGNRLFIATTRWKIGTPATLVWVDLPSEDKSPLLRPYPNWSYHVNPSNPDCTKIMSGSRIYVDECGRLWVFDSGLIDTNTYTPKALCPPKIMIFDLATDKPLFTIPIPKEQTHNISLYFSLTVDVREGRCEDAHAYLADAERPGLVVFSWAKKRSWRTAHQFMLPNPHACEHNFKDQIHFQWYDGIFSSALGPVDSNGDRLLYFHPMSSFSEFSVPTSVLQNETLWYQLIPVNEQFKHVGERGVNSQSSSSGIDRNGVLFYTLMNQDAIGCWDTNKVLVPENTYHVDQNRDIFSFPLDLKIDQATDQSIWILDNNLPFFVYTKLDYNQVNFRILRASVKDAVRNSVCDPKRRGSI